MLTRLLLSSTLDTIAPILAPAPAFASLDNSHSYPSHPSPSLFPSAPVTSLLPFSTLPLLYKTAILSFHSRPSNGGPCPPILPILLSARYLFGGRVGKGVGFFLGHFFFGPACLLSIVVVLFTLSWLRSVDSES